MAIEIVNFPSIMVRFQSFLQTFNRAYVILREPGIFDIVSFLAQHRFYRMRGGADISDVISAFLGETHKASKLGDATKHHWEYRESGLNHE